ncbi:hypothetical protein PHPALM_19647 [Phytophthora palmivora]|uniref:Uncharacterized protein n=1 Tax=Phytophthora palmivora TaxID=4796 RepID=A0A2P4XGW2_9STRA|nr:hypothetical protein PHPALM_19647 [Phytophthora palmivora]
MADAGSRVWTTGHPLFDPQLEESFDNIYSLGSMLRRHALAATTTTYTQHLGQWCRFAKQMRWSRQLTQIDIFKAPGVLRHILLRRSVEQTPQQEPLLHS